jgi:protein O-GlcNAcase/histone acetyltransferase
MNELDRKKFSTFVQAQISVTNEIFESLNCPKLFMFCPTGLTYH